MSHKHHRNVRWTTRTVYFYSAQKQLRFAALWSSFAPPFSLDCLRLDKDGYSQQHWAIGRIKYPGDSEYGYLLYLKSSVTGDEDEVIKEYRNASAEFPHESTADQFFGEGQFEAYRSLGQHIAEEVLREGGWCDYTANKLIRDSELSAQSTPAAQNDKMSYEDLGIWFKALAKLKSPGSTATHA